MSIIHSSIHHSLEQATKTIFIYHEVPHASHNLTAHPCHLSWDSAPWCPWSLSQFSHLCLLCGCAFPCPPLCWCCWSLSSLPGLLFCSVLSLSFGYLHLLDEMIFIYHNLELISLLLDQSLWSTGHVEISYLDLQTRSPLLLKQQAVVLFVLMFVQWVNEWITNPGL